MNWRLCGGTLLNRMGTALRQSSALEFTLFGEKTTVSRTGLLISLLNMVKPGFDLLLNNSFYNESSAYWNCRRYNKSAIPLDSPSITRDYLRRAERDYGSVRKDMELLCQTFLKVQDEDLMAYLTEELISLTLNDKTIPEFYNLYIKPDGSAMKKFQLRDVHSIDLPSLLVGLWVYVMTALPENTEGRELIKYWNTMEPSAQHNRSIIATITDTDQEKPAKDIPEPPVQEKPAKDIPEPAAKAVPEPPAEEQSPKVAVKDGSTIKRGNTTVHNYGNGNVQFIDHLDSMVINFYDD